MVVSCCRKGEAPLQGPKSGLLSNTRKIIVRGDVLTKQEVLLGKGTWVESSRVREPMRTALLCGSCKWLLQCLTRVGNFNQCASPNTSPLRDFILKILLGNWGGGLFLL